MYIYFWPLENHVISIDAWNLTFFLPEALLFYLRFILIVFKEVLPYAPIWEQSSKLDNWCTRLPVCLNSLTSVRCTAANQCLQEPVSLQSLLVASMNCLRNGGIWDPLNNLKNFGTGLQNLWAGLKIRLDPSVNYDSRCTNTNESSSGKYG